MHLIEVFIFIRESNKGVENLDFNVNLVNLHLVENKITKVSGLKNLINLETYNYKRTNSEEMDWKI